MRQGTQEAAVNPRLIALLAGALALFTTAAIIESPSQQGQQPELGLLRRDAGGQVELTQNPQTGTPSFIRTRVPVAALALAATDTSAVAVGYGFVGRYAGLMGIARARDELQPGETVTDDLGMRSVALHQVHEGVRVYGGAVRLHFSRDGQFIVAVGNGFLPRIRVRSTRPTISADSAVGVARQAMPGGAPGSPALVVYPGVPARGAPKLAWLVEVRDDSIPARNVYVVDADNGDVLDVLDRLYTARDRKTYDANNTTTLPGTLRRSEGTGPVGDQDVDNAHDFAGATYDYYANTHGRDSYDNAGATLISTANYGANYQNAFWDGQQMVYGDGFAVNDVAAHELTHAVTERTAGLEYRWQSGALNESFSDIFGAMVDRDDWVMGEDLPIGAIRDLSDPTRFGDPGHTSQWVKTCDDNQGVHTNSGIPNKAYYNVATAIGKEKAERIFYRTLVTYLQSTSGLEDARAAALQSAEDLYGAGSTEFQGVQNGFDAVGLDGVWQPPTNNCPGGCFVTQLFSDRSVSGNEGSARATLATLYRVRESLFGTTVAGRHYRDLYERHSRSAGYVVLRDARLRSAAGGILRGMTPGLKKLTDGRGDEVRLTAGVVTELRSFLRRLAEQSRKRGAHRLARDVEREMQRIDWDRLPGMSFAAAWAYVSSGADREALLAARD
jgi:Zn-dependent metalloprotease